MSAQPTEEQKLAFRAAFEQGGILAAQSFALEIGGNFECPICDGDGGWTSGGATEWDSIEQVFCGSINGCSGTGRIGPQ